MDKLAKKRMIAIAKDTVKNPAKALLGGPSLSEAKKILKKFGVKKKMSGGIMKASSGKMTEADLQKKVDRDAKISKTRKAIEKIKRKEFNADPFQSDLAVMQKQKQKKLAQQRAMEAQGMSKGGMCRGMGAAIRGGDFKGVK
tara:strand:- start:164 stop:589 length:426 start_codon:yes stop_codon:yes gene_type:complete